MTPSHRTRARTRYSVFGVHAYLQPPITPETRTLSALGDTSQQMGSLLPITTQHRFSPEQGKAASVQERSRKGISFR